jgi:hypothetical protein
LTGGATFGGSNTNPTALSCDFYGNVGRDWTWILAGQADQNDNMEIDPFFCLDGNPEEPYTLHQDSPCAPANNVPGVLVGAWDVGCQPSTGVAEASETSTWGRIKAAYR